MTPRRIPSALVVALLLALLSVASASASFHFMQIEQVIGATCGRASEQAIQLRLRSAGQNLVSQARLNVRDATGANPVLLLNITSDVAGSGTGARVLLTTADFAATNSVTPDFTLANRIPASYLAAGRLTFEDDFGTIYWSLAWGGAGYTGSNAGNTANDADGNFGPPFGSALSSATSVAVLFPGAAGAASTNNAADYMLTSTLPTFTNNAGAAVQVLDCVFGDGFESGGTAAWSMVVP
jgi:hypothetical protein